MKLLIKLFIMYLDFLRGDSMEIVEVEMKGNQFKLNSIQDGVKLDVSAEMVPEGIILQYIVYAKEVHKRLFSTVFVGNNGYSGKYMTAVKSSETRKIHLETRVLQTEDEVVRFLQPGGTDEVSVEDAMKIHSILTWLVE
jgi:exosome complex RNA-binding protein Rrp4